MSERSEALAASKPALRPGLAELYALQVAPLQRLAYLLTGDHHLAEDITQQAFIKFYGRFYNLRDPLAAAGYLRKTIVNLARAKHRRHQLERAYLQRQNHTPVATELPNVEDHALVIQALLALPHRQRTAIVLRFFEDLSEAQAASEMGGAIYGEVAKETAEIKITLQTGDTLRPEVIQAPDRPYSYFVSFFDSKADGMIAIYNNEGSMINERTFTLRSGQFGEADE